jgi:hypothetical protein
MPGEGDLGAAGTEYETGAMGGDVNDPGMPRELISPVREPRRQRQEEPQLSTFADPDFSQQEPVEVEAEEPRPAKRVQPRVEPPKFDWMQQSAEVRQRGQHETQEFLRQTAGPMLQRLAQLPDPRTVSPEQVAALTPEENARYMQAIAERSQLESNLGMLPTLAKMQNRMTEKQSTDIVHIQRQVAEQFPDIAAAILDQAKLLGSDAQAMPETYEFLVDRELGRKVREQQASKRISSAGARVSTGGRGGYGTPARSEGITSTQRGQLARMFSGLPASKRNAAMNATLQRLGDD